MTWLDRPEARMLLAAVRACPGDRQRWWVLADWLTHHGDIRGQLIALSLQRAEHGLSSAADGDLQRRIEAIEASHQATWRAELPLPETTRLHWHRGFVVGVELRWDADTLEALAEIGARSTSALLDFLVVRDADINDDNAVALASSPALEGLTMLFLCRTHITDHGAIALASSPVLRSLVRLDLEHNEIGDEGAKALASSSTLAGLSILNLDHNHIGDEGAKAFARSLALRALCSLDLVGNCIGDEGAEALATSSALSGLESLYLSHNRITGRGASALSASSALRSLAALTLFSDSIDEGDIDAIKALAPSSRRVFV